MSELDILLKLKIFRWKTELCGLTLSQDCKIGPRIFPKRPSEKRTFTMQYLIPLPILADGPGLLDPRLIKLLLGGHMNLNNSPKKRFRATKEKAEV